MRGQIFNLEIFQDQTLTLATNHPLFPKILTKVANTPLHTKHLFPKLQNDDSFKKSHPLLVILVTILFAPQFYPSIVFSSQRL